MELLKTVGFLFLALVLSCQLSCPFGKNQAFLKQVLLLSLRLLLMRLQTPPLDVSHALLCHQDTSHSCNRGQPPDAESRSPPQSLALPKRTLPTSHSWKLGRGRWFWGQAAGDVFESTGRVTFLALTLRRWFWQWSRGDSLVWKSKLKQMPRFSKKHN